MEHFMRRWISLALLISSISIAGGLQPLPAQAGMAKGIATRSIQTTNPNLIKVQDYIGQEYHYKYPQRAQRLTYEEAMQRATPLARTPTPRPSPQHDLFVVEPYVVEPPVTRQRVNVKHPCAAHPSGHCGTSVYK